MKLLRKSPLARTVVYTFGHFFIAATCIYFITGTSLELASVTAFIEPLANSGWFYLLDKFISKQ